jgi:hypothetical protein
MSATRKELEQVLLLNTAITAEQLQGYRDCDVRQAVKQLNDSRAAAAAATVRAAPPLLASTATSSDSAARQPSGGSSAAAAVVVASPPKVTGPAPVVLINTVMAATPLALPPTQGNLGQALICSTSARKPPSQHLAAAGVTSPNVPASLDDCNRRIDTLQQHELIQSVLQSSQTLKEAYDDFQTALLNRKQPSLPSDLFDEIERECWLHELELSHAPRCMQAFDRWLSLLRQVFLDRQAQGGARPLGNSAFLARFNAKQRALQQLIALEEERSTLLFTSTLE